MQVYEVQQVSEHGIVYEKNHFRNFQDIIPSLQISYSKAKNLVIDKLPSATGPVKITVTGEFDEPFKHEYHVTRLPVWDSPTHM